MSINERLAALVAAGTSPWLDQIRRSPTERDELQRLVDEDSLRGVTSNPAIFERAILGSSDYDGQIEYLARAGAPARAIYQDLVIGDVQQAADVLRPAFDELAGADGFVSLEVDPDLAFDSERTIAQAREYWERVDRPNAMIKIPGTPECLPAIEQAIYEGININVTLLFSVDAYATVADAYLRGLERRRAQGLHLDVHSVASFFVSRVDSEVDKRLEALGRTDLLGQAAVANARAAYGRFEQIFRGERFAALRAAGATVQRPLWASTGVKSPLYADTKYVAQLVGSATVNTMPMQTLLACSERLELCGETVREDPAPALEALREAGIDLGDVTDTLLRQGIDAFVTPMQKLLAGIEAKRELFAAQEHPVAASRAEERVATPGLSPRPRRKMAMLACMDTRIDLFAMLGLARGDAHIIRNAGALVTDDAIRSLSASQRLLGTEEIVVVMHDGCGLHGASEDDFARELAADGVLPNWRLGAFDNVELTLRHGLARLARQSGAAGPRPHSRLHLRPRDRGATRAEASRRLG